MAASTDLAAEAAVGGRLSIGSSCEDVLLGAGRTAPMTEVNAK